LLLALSRLVDENVLLTTLTRYLALVIRRNGLIAKQANELWFIGKSLLGCLSASCSFAP
jgi:hypothetical protein